MAGLQSDDDDNCGARIYLVNKIKTYHIPT